MSEWENGLKPWLGPPPSPDSQTWIPPVTPLPAPPTHQLMDDTASQQVRAGHVSPSLGSLTCEIGDKSCSAYTPKWSSWSNEIIGSFTHIPEKAMAPHSSSLAWKIPWTEEPGRLQSMGLLGVGHDWATSLSLFTFNPLQCSCLENPRDGGAWQAAVYGVSQSRTRLKRLSSSSSHPHSRNPYWAPSAPGSGGM